MRPTSQQHRAFAVTVAWTLVLLTLGSVVHATESSLACPDWPTCFGTLMPEMSGGVFWEHLHRLVAGGLILMFALATWYVRRETPERRGRLRLCVAGLVLLLVQAVFGGLTVILLLPDAISTTHLGLAFIFLAVAVVLATRTSPRIDDRTPDDPSLRRLLRVRGWTAAGAVFLQSLLGAAVRHADAGMACPDIPTCLGEWVPPLTNGMVALHFTHRVAALVAAVAVLWLVVGVLRSATAPAPVRRAGWATLALLVAQITLGVLSVTTVLDVVPVSLHTLGAAALLALVVMLATWGRPAPSPIAPPVAATSASAGAGR